MLPIVFNSNEQGAPTLNNAAGSLLSVLKACLVTGFNNVGITSVTISGNVATVVTNANHGLTVGQRATVAGVSITAANGDKTVASVPNVTTFTYPCVNPDVSESPASASVKRTPLGWVEQFSKTNVSMFKPSAPTAYGQSLRVDDTDTTGLIGGRVFGVENPTGIDAWTDKFPTEAQVPGGMYWPRSSNTATAKAWCVVGDERFFYLLMQQSTYSSPYYPTSSGDYVFSPFFFGDIVSFKNGESFGAIIGGGTSTGSANYPGSGLLSLTTMGSVPVSSTNSYISRQQSGVAKSIPIGFVHAGGRSSIGETNYPRYPSPVDNGLVIVEPSFVVESLSYANNPIRGVLPGFASFMCNYTDLPKNPLPQNLATTDGSGKTYLFAPATVVSTPNSYAGTFAVKISESWR